MMPPSGNRCRALLAGVALLAFAALAPACGAPSDESRLRVVSFGSSEGPAISSYTSLVNVTTVDATGAVTGTESGPTDFVIVVFSNQSTIVGTDLQAGGVTVDRVRITYAAGGYPLPAATYAVSLYVPVSTTGETTTNSELSVPLVSAELKSWIRANVPASRIENGLDGSARLEFHARTDEGGELAVEAGIGLHFQNGTAEQSQ